MVDVVDRTVGVRCTGGQHLHLEFSASRTHPSSFLCLKTVKKCITLFEASLNNKVLFKVFMWNGIPDSTL